MRIFAVLSFISVLMGTSISLEYSCSSESEQCTVQPEYKYLFYDVSSQEGFNLRRDVYMRYAIMFNEMRKDNERLNWKLVLPPFYRLPHWRNEKPSSEPIQWSAFFDIESLKSYAPVIEVKDLFKNNLPYVEIDRVYILQNYEDAFENGVFAEKWDVMGKCDYLNRPFWIYVTKTKETVCVQFQGRVSKLWELISLHPYDNSVMIYNAEIPLHDFYGTKSYWDCRKSMKFNYALLEVAMEYTAKFFQCYRLKCDTYISVHWRRGDFSRSRKNEVPSIQGTARQIVKAVLNENLKTRNVYVATDADSTEMAQLQRSLLNFGFYAYFYEDGSYKDVDVKKFRDGAIAIIEQIICSHAAYFIGTHESTFTYRIQEEREILGFNTSLTFNRLCPDIGNCDSPSIWKIIH